MYPHGANKVPLTREIHLLVVILFLFIANAIRLEIHAVLHHQVDTWAVWRTLLSFHVLEISQAS